MNEKFDLSRKEMAHDIASYINSHYLSLRHGGVVEKRKNGKGHVYYRVGFSTLTTIDGEVNVYGSHFTLVWYASTIKGLEGEWQRVFDSPDNAVDFIRLAFVQGKIEDAFRVPLKKGSEPRRLNADVTPVKDLRNRFVNQSKIEKAKNVTKEFEVGEITEGAPA